MRWKQWTRCLIIKIREVKEVEKGLAKIARKKVCESEADYDIVDI